MQTAGGDASHRGCGGVLIASLSWTTSLTVRSMATVTSAGALVGDNKEMRTPRAMVWRRHQARGRLLIRAATTQCIAPTRQCGNWAARSVVLCDWPNDSRRRRRRSHLHPLPTRACFTASRRAAHRLNQIRTLAWVMLRHNYCEAHLCCMHPCSMCNYAVCIALSL